MRNKIILFSLLLSCVSCKAQNAPEQPQPTVSYTLCNPNATAETQQLWSVLCSEYGKRAMSGVVANVDWNARETENVYAWTGKYPALNVFDFINIHASKDVNPQGWLDYSDLTPVIDWFSAGGVVGCMWHWQNAATAMKWILESFAELGGGTAFGLPEETVKMAEGVESAGITYFRNR